MNKKLPIIIILIGVFVGFMVFFANRGEDEAINSPMPTPTPTQPQVSPYPSPPRSTIPPNPTPVETAPVVSPYPPVVQATLNITDSGFSPNELTVKAGDSVRFVNQGNQLHWVASAVHPTHEAYPGSSISKCGSDEAIFDSCRGLAKEGSFAFTFESKGTWYYHDHLNPSLTGKIIVQ